MVWLTRIEQKESFTHWENFPFSIPVLRATEVIELNAQVTIFVGENGSGKSTLMEAIALGCRLPALGGEDPQRDRTLEAVRPLAQAYRFGWRRRTRRGFFLRAEDFFNFVKRTNEKHAELAEYAERYKDEYFAGPAMRGQLRAHEERYEQDLDAHSHGETFLKIFQTRFVPDGLYLLDEPEAALSPQRQLAFLALLKDMTAQGAQFIIATHSPIIMAFPEACLLSFDEEKLTPVDYEDLEHVRLLRHFLQDPQAYLRRL